MPRLNLQLIPTINPETPLAGRFSLPFATLGALALLASWLAPNHYPPWTSFHGEAAAFVALISFCAAFLAARRTLLCAPELLFTTVCLLLLISLQWTSGQIAFLGDALLSSLYLVGFAFAWCLGQSMAGTANGLHRALTRIAVLFVIGATASVWIATLQWLRMESVLGIFAADRGRDMRVFANLAQPNHLSTLVLIGSVLAIGLYRQQRLRIWHLGGLLVWFSFGLTLTESRTGLLTAFLLALLWAWSARRVRGLGHWTSGFAWLSLLLALAIAWGPVNEGLYLQPARDAVLSSDHARRTMWLQALAAIRQNPWLGWGWRQTVVAQKAGADLVPGALATDYAHNVILDIVLWIGIPIGGLLVLMGAVWLVRAFVRIATPMQFVLFATALPVIVHSMFEFPFAYAYFLFPVGGLLGMLTAPQRGSAQFGGAAARRKMQWGATGLVTAYAAVCLAVAGDYFRAEEDYRIMRFELRQVGKTPVSYVAPNLRLLTQLDATLKAGRLVPRPNMPEQEIELLRRVQASQAWAMLQLNYAIALGLNGRPEEASYQLRNLQAVYGPDVYRQVSTLFKSIRETRYPQLAAVQLP